MRLHMKTGVLWIYDDIEPAMTYECGLTSNERAERNGLLTYGRSISA